MYKQSTVYWTFLGVSSNSQKLYELKILKKLYNNSDLDKKNESWYIESVGKNAPSFQKKVFNKH